MKKGDCPNCGGHLGWDDQDFEWICNGCGDVFTNDELEEAQEEADSPS